MLHQKSIAELEKRAYAEMRDFERYIPSENEKNRGSWALVLEKLDEDGDPDWNSPRHIVPTFGTYHYLTDRCWCEPDKDKDGLWIHRPSQ